MNDPVEVRKAIRAGRHRRNTAGIARGYVQGNVCILPREYAADFRAFCEANPKPSPLLAMSAPGDPRLPGLGEDLDIRTDVPAYRIFRNGKQEGDVTDLRDLWREDLVTFVLGCSFSFEEALMQAGLRLRYVEQGTNVPMYRTASTPCPPAASAASSWSQCAPSSPPMRSARSRSPRAIHACMARPSTWVFRK